MDSILQELDELRALTAQVRKSKNQKTTEELSARIWDAQMRIQSAWDAKEALYLEARRVLALIEAKKVAIAQAESQLAESQSSKNYPVDHLDMVPLEQFLEENPELIEQTADERAILVARLRDEQRRRVIMFQERRQVEAKVQATRDEVQYMEERLRLGDRKIFEIIANLRGLYNKLSQTYQ